jgi:hypothetical protein
VALRSPALYMGNPAVNHTAQNDRLLLAGLLRPEAGETAANRPLAGISGVLAGPDGTMGEVTLLSNTQFTVNPARWFVQSTESPLGGMYEVTNDAVETLTTLPAQDASQSRRCYFGVWVIDSFTAGSGDDLPHWGLIQGALAASNPALPLASQLPANFLALGEFLIPPTGQAVTWTAYNVRTGLRGGILPVPATDTRVPAYDGAPRWHATSGLQFGRAGAWVNPGIGIDGPVCKVYRSAAQAMPTGAFTPIVWDVIDFDPAGMAATGSADLTARRDGYYWITAGWDAATSAAGRRIVQVTRSRSGGAYTSLSVGRSISAPTSVDNGVEASGLVSLLTGDKIHAEGWQDSGVSLNTGNPGFAPTGLSAVWLRPL